MKITFNKNDEELVAKLLDDHSYTPTPKRIKDVLYNVEAAFQQQLKDEIEYMIDKVLV